MIDQPFEGGFLAQLHGGVGRSGLGGLQGRRLDLGGCKEQDHGGNSFRLRVYAAG
jgi:hypothetical protein